MSDFKITLTCERNGKFLKTKEYHGHGQILKISDDGFECHIVLESEDPVFGVTIKYIESGKPYLSFPDISLENLDMLEANINNAKAFCSEFCLRKSELLER